MLQAARSTFAPVPMHHPMHPWTRRLLLACTMLLGLQLCFPLTLQACAVSNPQVDVISLGTKDPASKPGVQVDFDPPPARVPLLIVPVGLHRPLPEHAGTDDVPLPVLLPVAGYHPSAP